MLPFQQRVVDEKTELDARLDALHRFFATKLYISLPEDERARLSRQHHYMAKYSEILRERIEAFTTDSVPPAPAPAA